jgi:nitronate monooxygenase
MLHSRFTEMFGLDYPLMSAPMTLHSGGVLAGAVSAAGGLGSFGGIHLSNDPNWIRSEIEKVRKRTDRPFAIGFITGFIPFVEPLFEASLIEVPALIALSFGDPAPWIERCRSAGSRVICQVQTYAHADLAVEAGADALVAQGTDAGGHTGEISLLPLLAGVAERHPDIPLLAAGGIGDGRTLAAALTAGADGAWLGTAFLATPEAMEIDDVYKRLIVESDGADTVYTHAYNIVSGYPWPPGIGERVRRNRFTEEWADREAELRTKREQVAATRIGFSAISDEDVATREVLYGQSARFVTAVRPVAEVMRSICEEAERQLRSRPPSFLR